MSRLYNRRDFLKLAGMAGASLALAGCSSKAATDVATEAGTVDDRGFKKTNLVVPSWWAPHEIAGAEASFAGKFHEETGLTLKYEFIGTNFNEKVFTNLASDTPYDVISYNADSVPVYRDRDLLTPLNSFIDRDGYDTSNIVPSALSQWTYEWEINGLTADMGSYHDYFNNDLNEKAWNTPPKPTEDWTWDQLWDYAKKLTITDGDNITQYGLVVDTDWCWEAWPGMNGAFIFDEALENCVVDDAAAIEAYAFYQDLMYKENACIKPGATKIAINDLFLGGQAAIMFNGTWQVGYLRSKKEEMKAKWDVGLLPHGPKVQKPVIPNFTAGWVLPKVAQDPDASWEAIKYYASDTFAEEVMFVVLSGLPTTKSALAGAWYAQWPDNPPEGLTRDFYSAMLDRGAARRHLRFDIGAEITASLAKLDMIYSNEKKPSELLPEIAAEVNAVLKEKPWN